ncbi:MAG: hypothetical protein KC646_01030 [Candidatus Cloacimonetes bacterium]|nr:hypothetical protein [Candidatus Cloacimonadota bacterium]
MKFLLFFIFTIQSYICNDFFVYHCKYVSAKALVQKISIFRIKGKFTPSNHSTIIYFGDKLGFQFFKKFASSFDIKPIMISGQVQLSTQYLNSKLTLTEYSNQNQSQWQTAAFKGLSGTNIKIQLGEQTVKKLENLYQITNSGLYLNLIPVKIGDHFEVDLSIRSSALHDKTLYSSQKLIVNNGSWTSVNNFTSSQNSKTKHLGEHLKDLVNKQNSLLGLKARIVLYTND